MFNSFSDSATQDAEQPVSTTLGLAAYSALDRFSVIDGLSEGELRVAAAVSLGTEAVAGMVLSELVEWYKNPS